MRPTIWSLFEPHYKQNLYANPKRTAKSFRLQLIDTTHLRLFKRFLVVTAFSLQQIDGAELKIGRLTEAFQKPVGYPIAHEYP